MLLEASMQIAFQYFKFPLNGEIGMKCCHLYYMVYGQQHFQGVSVISSDILNNFLEVYEPPKHLQGDGTYRKISPCLHQLPFKTK